MSSNNKILHYILPYLITTILSSISVIGINGNKIKNLEDNFHKLEQSVKEDVTIIEKTISTIPDVYITRREHNTFVKQMQKDIDEIKKNQKEGQNKIETKLDSLLDRVYVTK